MKGFFKKQILILLLIGIVGLGVSYELSANLLTVTKYSIYENVKESIRVVQLTDLHNWEFGKNNARLVKKVMEQNPDIIFMTGDMINKDNVDIEIICSLIKKLSEIAPVYYSYGNHEIEWKKNYQKDLKKVLMDAGAIVLDSEYIDENIKGMNVRIGGYYGYYRTPHMITNNKKDQKEDIAFADNFEKTTRIKLLLCHIPTSWVDWKYINKYPVDVVFSGHYHGGQIRIPFIGGFYAPYVGWFPRNTKGIFTGKCATCVLSTGLGTEPKSPRLNNLPEITVVDVKSKK